MPKRLIVPTHYAKRKKLVLPIIMNRFYYGKNSEIAKKNLQLQCQVHSTECMEQRFFCICRVAPVVNVFHEDDSGMSRFWLSIHFQNSVDDQDFLEILGKKLFSDVTWLDRFFVSKNRRIANVIEIISAVFEI